MADVAATLVRATAHALVYAITNSAGGADQLTITNAVLQGHAAGQPTLLEMLQTAVANDAAAVNLLLARAPGQVGLVWGEAQSWHIDAVNGGGLADLVLDSAAGVTNNGLLILEFIHSTHR